MTLTSVKRKDGTSYRFILFMRACGDGYELTGHQIEEVVRLAAEEKTNTEFLVKALAFVQGEKI